MSRHQNLLRSPRFKYKWSPHLICRLQELAKEDKHMTNYLMVTPFCNKKGHPLLIVTLIRIVERIRNQQFFQCTRLNAEEPE